MTCCFYDMPGPYYSSSFRTQLPTDGTVGYAGVRLTIDGQYHYGWVAAYNKAIGVYYGEQFFSPRVVAWGYETRPGVAIAAGVPGPAPLGVLAIGAAGALGRRKRAA